MATEYKLSYTAEEIDNRLGRVASISEDVGSLQSNVGSLQGNVDSLQGDVGTLQTDVQSKAEIIQLTTAEFEALGGNANENTLYMLTDAEDDAPSIELDTTLTEEGKAADAKAVGDAVNDLNTLIGDESVSTQIDFAISQIKQVPASTTSDNGKFLRVVNGAPAWTTVPSAEEASF